MSDTKAASAGTPLLWPDERISMFSANCATAWEARAMFSGLRKVRDDYERELDALRSANATLKAAHDGAWDEVERYHNLMLDMEQELVELRARVQEMGAWQPLEDGVYGLIKVDYDGTDIGIQIDKSGDPNNDYQWLSDSGTTLGKDIRLCRLAPASQPASDGANAKEGL